MPKLIIAAFVLVLMAAMMSIAGILPPLVPQALFALSLVALLLNVVNESDEKRL
jgi:hypothetical protein